MRSGMFSRAPKPLRQAGWRRPIVAACAMLVALGGSLLGGIALLPPTASAITPPPTPFKECPAVGYNTSCSDLIDVTTGGTAIFFDPHATTPSDPLPGTYDGDDDTLIGVINNTSGTISSLPLSSTTEPIMGFDGDGICDNPNSTSGLPGLPASDCSDVNHKDTTTYGGPDSYFPPTSISPDQMSGTVDFITPLAPGKSTYFSLEEALTPQNFMVGCTPPVVKKVVPIGNPKLEFVRVLIEGSCFTGASAVYFGSTPTTNFTVLNHGTVILAGAPSPSPNLTGTSPTKVPVGVNAVPPPSNPTYTYYPPNCYVVVPSNGASGSVVKILGSGFSEGPPLIISFGGSTTTGTPNAGGSLITGVVVPPHAPGMVSVKVTTETGSSRSGIYNCRYRYK